jgi:hypothetical protein
MTRQQLEHLIRAAAVIANDDELVVIGSPAHRELVAKRIERDFAAAAGT